MNKIFQAIKDIQSATVRELDVSLTALPNLTASAKGNFALINSHYFSIRCYEEKELASMLHFSCLRLAESPTEMMRFAHLLRSPTLLQNIAAKIVKADRIQKTNVPTIYLPTLQMTISQVLSNMGKDLGGGISISHPIVDIFTYLIATPIAKAGMLVKGENTYVVSTDTTLVPTWEQIKGYALADILRNHIQKAKIEDLIRDKQVIGSLLLQPLIHAFSSLAGQVLSIHDRWLAFDRLGFLAAVLTLQLEEDYPEFKGLRSHPEIIAFLNNQTLVELAVARYMHDVSSATFLGANTISSATFAAQAQGLVTSMTATEELSVVPLTDFVNNTSVAWVGTADRELVAVIAAPRFAIDAVKVDVSYIDRRASRGEPAVSMVQLDALEPVLTAALQPVQAIVQTDAIDFYNIYAEALLSAKDETDGVFTPMFIGFKADEMYVKLMAASLAAQLSYSREGEITYIFAPQVPDYNSLLGPASERNLVATQDPALVVAFASTQLDAEGLKVISRADASWKIGKQNIPQDLRALPCRGYVATDGTIERKAFIFPDDKNTLDQQDNYRFNFNEDVVDVKMSFYELLMNQKSFFSAEERNVVVAHRQPMVAASVSEFFGTVVQLYAACDQVSRDTIATAFADYLASFVANGAVASLVTGIKTMIAHSADEPSARRRRSVTLKQPALQVSLYKDVIMKLLLRCSVISHSTYEEVLASDLYTAKTLDAVLRSRVTAHMVR